MNCPDRVGRAEARHQRPQTREPLFSASRVGCASSDALERWHRRQQARGGEAKTKDVLIGEEYYASRVGRLWAKREKFGELVAQRVTSGGGRSHTARMESHTAVAQRPQREPLLLWVRGGKALAELIASARTLNRTPYPSPARFSCPASLPRLAGSMRMRAVTAPLSSVSSARTSAWAWSQLSRRP